MTRVAKKLKVDLKYLIKELLFMVNNEPVMVISDGVGEIDIAELAKLLKVDPSECTFATESEIEVRL